jgi:iron complex transport system substrate-binding protein
LPAAAVLGLAAALGGAIALRRGVPPEAARPVETPAAPRRIVSLAPSITETLFALGLGERVVGVTRYCTYPPEAVERDKVGGFEDVSFEALAALKPDLVALLDAHRDVAARCAAMGWPVLTVRHKTLEGILDSVVVIGRACGVPARAAELADTLRARMDAVRSTVRDRPRPRVLMALGDAIGEESAGQIYIVGRGGFYDSLLELAGGRNAYEGSLIFPSVSVEGVLGMNPDVIVCLTASRDQADDVTAGVLRRWRSFGGLKAVRDGAVHVLGGGYVMVPGPRFVETLDGLARILHPEADWRAAAEGVGHD